MPSLQNGMQKSRVRYLPSICRDTVKTRKDISKQLAGSVGYDLELDTKK